VGAEFTPGNLESVGRRGVAQVPTTQRSRASRRGASLEGREPENRHDRELGADGRTVREG
jgi:hypothetical protein